MMVPSKKYVNDAGVAHTNVSLRVNRRSGSLPRDSSSTFVVWVGEFSGSLSAVRQMLADVPPPRLLVASQECAAKHHTSEPKEWPHAVRRTRRTHQYVESYEQGERRWWPVSTFPIGFPMHRFPAGKAEPIR
ncbi:hypothetical protein PJI16_15520 [Nitrospira sp. MA-1]|nr:hypothetical protein [Nitrospira sp. MA-1]